MAVETSEEKVATLTEEETEEAEKKEEVERGGQREDGVEMMQPTAISTVERATEREADPEVVMKREGCHKAIAFKMTRILGLIVPVFSTTGPWKLLEGPQTRRRNKRSRERRRRLIIWQQIHWKNREYRRDPKDSRKQRKRFQLDIALPPMMWLQQILDINPKKDCIILKRLLTPRPRRQRRNRTN